MNELFKTLRDGGLGTRNTNDLNTDFSSFPLFLAQTAQEVLSDGPDNDSI